jgi:UDP-N-acetylmuramyl pentapeptide phosphotransferase/UDP-N-acetylglucosamine-1-phosphate transferase
MIHVVLVVLAFVTAVFLTRRLSEPGSFLYAADHPNERSLHQRPTARTGGVAVGAGALVSFAVLFATTESPGKVTLAWTMLAALVVALISWFDDRRPLNWSVRLGVHFLAAWLIAAEVGSITSFGLPGMEGAMPDWVGKVLAVFFVVWMANLYNFMDGMDGFAGGMSVIGFSTLALLGTMAGAEVFAGAALVIAASAAGFLVWNFPPARIFLGDVGSVPLGVSAAGMILWGARDGIFPYWIGVLVFSPFIIDATLTIIRRILGRERIWQAHRSHYYQRLVMLGWGHRRTVLWEYGIMAACAASAIIVNNRAPVFQWIIVVFWFLAYAAMALVVGQLEARRGLRTDG